MTPDFVVNIVFGIIGLIGTIAAFIFEYKARQLARERFRFSWLDVWLGTRELSGKAIRDFKPDLLITTPGGPQVVANLLLEHTLYFVPQYCCLVSLVNGKTPHAITQPLGYSKLKTPDYELFIPSLVTDDGGELSKRRILIVEDAVRLNQVLPALFTYLVEKGYAAENIRSCALIATSPVLKSNYRPTWVHFEVRATDFFLPWGKV